MLIKWLGHACFKVETEGESVVFDPFADGSVPGFRDIDESANLVLYSHTHKDHYGLDCVNVTPLEKEVFKVTKLDSYHDDQQGSKRGANTIHLVESEGFRFAHLGDLGCDLTDKQIELLQDLDVLMIPVGGYFTIDALKAKEIVGQLNPKVIIPMHYRAEEGGYDVLAPVESFTKYFDKVTWLTTDTFEFSDELDGEVVVFDYVVQLH